MFFRLLRNLSAVMVLMCWGASLAFDPDDRWDSSMGGCDSPILAMTEGPDGRIYVGGGFSECGSVAVASVAVYDPTMDSWHALEGSGGNGMNGGVNALTFHQGALYVGGLFQQTNDANPIPANRVARWDPSNQSWSALATATGNGVSGQVLTLLSHGNELYVGGDFFSANVGDSLTVRNVARWDGTNWAPLASADGGIGTSSRVEALASNGDAVYAGGDFQFVGTGGSIGPVEARRVARWSSADGWSALGSGTGNGVNDLVHALEWSDGLLYVGGMFGLANSGDGITANRLAIWDGSQWLPMDTPSGQGANGVAFTLAQSSQRSYIGGTFTEVNVGDPIAANRLAWWDGNGFGAMGSGADTTVRSLVAGSDGWIYVAGNFTEIGGQPAASFARYRPAGALNIEIIGSGSGAIAIQPLDLSCTSECTQTLDWDQSLTLESEPGPFSVFAGFSDVNCVGTNPCIFDFEQDTTVIAQFDLVTYPVEITTLVGSGSITPSLQSVEHGSNATWVVSPDSGWAVHAFNGDTCSPLDNGDGTWSASDITAACNLEIEFRPDLAMSVTPSMNPAIVGMLVTYEVSLTSTVSTPLDGQITVVASTGETCTDETSPPPSDGLTVFFSCELLYSGTGPRSLLVAYSASSTHVSVEDETIVQQVVGTEFIFQDRFEEE